MSEELKEFEIVETEDASVETQKKQIDEASLLEIQRILELEMIESRMVYLNDAIDEESVSEIVQMIHMFNREDEGLEDELKIPIKVFVNSQGGELYQGNRLKSAMLGSTTPVWTYLEGGMAFSMGMIIFLCGSRRFMSESGVILYHELRAASDVQTLAEMKNIINHYSKVQDQLDEFIVSRTSIPMKKLKKYRKRNLDWYIDFTDAKKYKIFHDEI